MCESFYLCTCFRLVFCGTLFPRCHNLLYHLARFLIENVYDGFLVEPCMDTVSVNSNQLMHIFSKNTLKSCKILSPRHVSDHTGIHPQGAITRSWLKYLQVHGASPYSRYCVCIGKPVCVCCLLYGRGLLKQSSSIQQTVHTNRFTYAATMPTIRTRSMNL